MAPLLLDACDELPGRVDRALDGFDFRTATGALGDAVDHANRFAEAERPWQLARSGAPACAACFDDVLATLVHACRVLADELAPFLPGGAARLREQLGDGRTTVTPRPVFLRWDAS